LLAGAPRWRSPQPGLSTGASLHAALLALRGIFVRRRFLVRGPAVRAADDQSPQVTRDFTVVSFSPSRPAQHGANRSSRDLVGCLTSCALRLRKPHRTNFGPLASSVTRRRRNERSLRPLLATCHVPRRSRNPDDEHDRLNRRVRPPSRHDRIRAMTRPEPGRLPLARLHALRPKQTLTCSLVCSPARAPHPCRPPRVATVRRHRTGLAAEGYPKVRCVPFGPPRPRGKMRLPNVCNRLTTRAPESDRATPGLRRAKPRLTTSPWLPPSRRWAQVALDPSSARSCRGS
jgi:hypothetical protein